ncbi:MAG: hypothetical protein WAJ93_00175 [Candidatus Nitrosopolaris sp.]
MTAFTTVVILFSPSRINVSMPSARMVKMNETLALVLVYGIAKITYEGKRFRIVLLEAPVTSISISTISRP